MTSMSHRRVAYAFLVLWCCTGVGMQASADQQSLLVGHPRVSYEDVDDIQSMEEALRQHLAQQERYSFSRGWWKWDRLRARYVDGGRRDRAALHILRAVFRGLILDWHARLDARGEGDLFYLFFVTTAPGDKTRRDLNGRELIRDLHGGGYHGGWGGAARMRIYQELVRGDMLTAEEQLRVRQLVYQSLDSRFLDFSRGSQVADNHAFGNGGGIALAVKLFPDAPGAAAARAWLDRIWAHFADFGDWKEWTYYPYGPIFLHGVLDIAEATGKIVSERELITSVADRVLASLHGSGVRGHPNAGARVRENQTEVYRNPWDLGYYNVETSARDGHFWYRLAQHYRDPRYLWAAEQVLLGGRGPGETPEDYVAAYRLRFSWFLRQGIQSVEPAGKTSVLHLSPLRHRVPERLILCSSRAAGQPFVGFFLYAPKSAHLDNVAGHLFEYTYRGAKFLHTSGKYNNVYSGKDLRGGGTGEESLDLFLVVHSRHAFPHHPDRRGDERDFMRRGSLVLQEQGLGAATQGGDCYGTFGYENYYGPGSVWQRQIVLTREGYLVVADTFTPSPELGKSYSAGPVWHLAPDVTRLEREEACFDAASLDQAWWQSEQWRVQLHIVGDAGLRSGHVPQSHSQDTQPSITTFAYRPLVDGQATRFLSVLIPHLAETPAGEVASGVRCLVRPTFSARIGDVRVSLAEDRWQVQRNP